MLIELRNVCKTYTMGTVQVRAVCDLDLDIAEGEFVAVLGPSGSGKSTLMNMIGLMDRPTSGHLAIGGRPVNTLSEREMTALRRDTIGFVFQQFLLVPTMTALANVQLPMYFAGRPNGGNRARELLESVGLGRRMHHLPSQMSGGELQRVAIARALANKPQLLLADEPTANVDAGHQQQILALIKETCQEENVALIMVTHSDEVARQFPRVDHLDDFNRSALGYVEKTM